MKPVRFREVCTEAVAIVIAFLLSGLVITTLFEVLSKH